MDTVFVPVELQFCQSCAG